MPHLDQSRGYPRPQLVRDSWMSLNGTLGFRHRFRRRDRRIPRDVAWDADHRRAVRAGDGGERHRQQRAVPRALVSAHVRRAAGRCRLVCCCTSALSTTAPQSGSTDTSSARTRAATRRSPSTSPSAVAGRRPAEVVVGRRRRSRPISRSRAASRTGCSTRTRSGIRARPASGRRCGSSACPRRGSNGSAGRRTSSAGRSAASVWCGGRQRDGLRLHVRLTAGGTLLADDVYSRDQRRHASPHRALRSRHRRLSQRAAVEPGPAAA